jgi:hypothetical protein
MRNKVLPAGVLAAALFAIIASSPAVADCKQEVADAFDKQRKSSSFRMVTHMLNERGPMTMTVDYILPDRMHQTVKAAIDPAATESILIGRRGWVSAGSGWQQLPMEDALSLAEEMEKTVVKGGGEQPVFDCLGYVQLDGRKLKAYEAMQDKGAPEGSPTRQVYVDPITGLPARSIVAQKDNLDRPFFRQDYSYPQDIRIEAPTTTK